MRLAEFASDATARSPAMDYLDHINATHHTHDFPPDSFYEETGTRVFAALTMADRAHLRRTMRDAIRSEAGDQDDPWLCNLGNVGIWGQWGGRVTNAMLLSACIEMARAKSQPMCSAMAWGFILTFAFGDEHEERFQALYAEIPLGSLMGPRRPASAVPPAGRSVECDGPA